MEYKEINNIKYPQNLSPKKQALIDMLARNYAQEVAGIDEEKNRNIGSVRRGSALSALSGLPVFNIPYVGTGIGGALYDLGQGIAEGDEAAELAKRTSRGFAIGETVGAVPYVGKLASKTKTYQANIFDDSMTGRDIYSRLYDDYIRKDALQPHEILENNGIKGISYNGGIDGEAAVIFNPDDIDIVRKYYNQPTLKDIYNRYINAGAYAGAMTNP